MHVRRLALTAGLSALLAAGICAGTAGAQVDPAPQDTSTTAPETTTTAVPDTQPVSTAPPVTTADSTVAPETTTTTTAVPAPAVALPGQLVTSGSLSFDIRFPETPSSSCAKSVDLAGGQVNTAFGQGGRVGGVYGLVPSGTGSVGVYMVGLGAVPAGVGIVSVSDGTCEFDAVGIGAYSASAGSARLSGVGAGMHPGRYDTGEYVSRFAVEAQIGSTTSPATLDMASVREFLLRNRPGLVLPG